MSDAQEAVSFVNSCDRFMLHEAIENHAKQQPTAIALRFEDRALTYLELNQQANQLAHFLINVGVGPEVRVSVFFKPSLEVGIALLSIFKAGGVYIPLDPNYPQDRLTTLLEDNQPQVILTQAEFLPKLSTLTVKIFCCDRDWSTIEHCSTDNPNHVINLNQTAYIVYTSGTTGKPKGVMTSYGNLQYYISVAQKRFGFDQTMIMPAIARFSFSITFFELLSPLVAGGTLILLDREQILDFRRMCQILEQITVIHASPNLLKKLFNYIEENQIDIAKFAGLRHVSTGGDLAPVNVLVGMQKFFPNAEIYVIYGCTEVSCMGCSYFVSREQPVTKTLVGQPFSNVTIRLYDPEEQDLVPIGTSGEVYISGPGVTQGYLNRPELTAERYITIDQQRFYRTGDRGGFDPDGNLEILGRTDFQIKLNGMRIEPGEIESCLRQIPGVRESVVIQRKLSSGEPGIVAYVVLHGSNPPKIADLRSILQSKLPDYMIPSALVILESLPLTLNGKIDRHALPAPDYSRSDLEDSFVAPRNELEIELTKIWEKVLGVKPIGVTDNFFELGGQSFVAVRLFNEIEKVWGKNFPLAILFQKQTIAEFAEVMAQAEWAPSWSSLVPIHTQGSKTPLFLIHAIGGNVLEYGELARQLSEDRPIYGLQSVGLDGKQEPLTRVTDMANCYLKEIRTIQPYGPYLLFGYSFGGIIAFEIAQQLDAEGEKISFLGVCDQDSPNSVKVEKSLAGFVKLHLGNIWRIKGIKEKLNYVWERTVYRLTNYDYKKHLMGELSKNEVSTPDFLLKILDINMQAHRDYTAKVYPGSLVLFRCESQHVKHYFNPDLGWGEIVGKEVKIHYIDEYHFDILKGQTVAFIAETIKSYLD